MQNIMWGHPHCTSILCHTNQHTDLVNSSLITTANHSLTPSFSGYFHKQCKWPLCKRNYLQEATPISSVDQPMAEQAGQQATRIKKEAILTNIRLAWKTGCVSSGRSPVTRSESRGQPPAEVGELPAQRVEKRPVDPDVQSLWRMRVPTPSPPPVTTVGMALSDSEKAQALADNLETHFQPATDPSVPAVIETVDTFLIIL